MPKGTITRALILLVLLAELPADARPTEALVALTDCPNVGPNRACLPVEFRLTEDARANAASASEDPTGKLTKLHFLKGRLLGAKVRKYKLVVVYDRAYSEIAGVGIDVLPYRGRTMAHNPVILTKRGPLEITSKNFNTTDFSLLVVDAKHQKVVARYLVYEASLAYVVERPKGVEVWIKRDGLCISAVQDKPQMLSLNKRACIPANALGGANAFEERRPDFEPLLKLPELRWLSTDNISEDGQFLQDSGFMARVYRLRSGKHLLVYTWCNDCY
jgi:hypothetical protein